MLDSRADHHLFQRISVAVLKYREEILAPMLDFSELQFVAYFILMEDNGQSHKSPLVDDFLKTEDICWIF